MVYLTGEHFHSEKLFPGKIICITKFDVSVVLRCQCYMVLCGLIFMTLNLSDNKKVIGALPCDKKKIKNHHRLELRLEFFT